MWQLKVLREICKNSKEYLNVGNIFLQEFLSPDGCTTKESLVFFKSIGLGSTFALLETEGVEMERESITSHTLTSDFRKLNTNFCGVKFGSVWLFACRHTPVWAVCWLLEILVRNYS